MRMFFGILVSALSVFISPLQAAEECSCYWQLRTPVRGELDSLLTRVFTSHEKKPGTFCLESCTMEAVEHLRDTIQPTCRFDNPQVDSCGIFELNLHVDVALSDAVKVPSTDALRKPYVTADACTELNQIVGHLRDEKRYDLRACKN